MTDFREALESPVLKADLLRHCYRMLGSFADAEDVVQDVLLNAWRSRASYAGDAPVGHWLMRIATNACLNALASRKRRALPMTEREPSSGLAAIESADVAEWLGPAPDAHLFAPAAEILETRESVALAFLALLQKLPPKQRAVLLLKDVVGWSAEEIASALDLTVSSVNSALHRARETVKAPMDPPPREAPPEVVRAYLRSWETHDVNGLVAMLRDDIVFAMPPHATWFDHRVELERFLRESPFSKRWAAGFRVLPTRANGRPAFAFYHQGRRSSLQVVDFDGDKVGQIIAFIGDPYFRGFDVPETV